MVIKKAVSKYFNILRRKSLCRYISVFEVTLCFFIRPVQKIVNTNMYKNISYISDWKGTILKFG